MEVFKQKEVGIKKWMKIKFKLKKNHAQYKFEKQIL
jgi:hypothetical protein